MNHLFAFSRIPYLRTRPRTTRRGWKGYPRKRLAADRRLSTRGVSLSDDESPAAEEVHEPDDLREVELVGRLTVDDALERDGEPPSILAQYEPAGAIDAVLAPLLYVDGAGGLPALLPGEQLQRVPHSPGDLDGGVGAEEGDHRLMMPAGAIGRNDGVDDTRAEAARATA
jgi:hypothetical protein